MSLLLRSVNVYGYGCSGLAANKSGCEDPAAQHSIHSSDDDDLSAS